MTCRTERLRGAGGDEIEAYVARPERQGAYGGVVVIHHMPGWDAGSKEITRHVAALGYTAACPNLYAREAPGADPDDAAAASRAAGGVPDERVVGDVAAAAALLRAEPTSNGKVAVIGFCSGGRHTVLSAASLDLDAAVDCYGGFVTNAPPAGFPVPVRPIPDKVADLRCPLLGLFGAQDSSPGPEHVAELERLLREAGKAYELHTYDDAGHGFFSADRPAYRQHAAVDGWARIARFFGEHLD